jgi:hypothetical protein
MRQIAEFVAVLACGLFAGAAAYVSLACTSTGNRWHLQLTKHSQLYERMLSQPAFRKRSQMLQQYGWRLPLADEDIHSR